MKTKILRRHHRAMFWMLIGFIMVWAIVHAIYVPEAYGESLYPNLDKVRELSQEEMTKAYDDLCAINEPQDIIRQVVCLNNQKAALEGLDNVVEKAMTTDRQDVIDTIFKCANENIAPQGVIDWVGTLHCTDKETE